MTMLLAVVGAGLLLGVLAAALSAPLRGSGRIVATPLPGAAGGAARGGAAGDASDGAGGGPGGDTAGQNPAGAGAAAAGQGGAGRAGAGGQGGAARGAGSGASGGQASGAATGGTGGQAAGGPGGARGGAGGATAARTNGVIESIVDGTMVVNTPDGPVHVTLGEGTSVQRVEPAARADLAPGQRVVISGDRGGDGAVSASGVQILPETEGQGRGDTGQDEGQRSGAGGRQPNP
jgi:hypothetical protein